MRVKKYNLIGAVILLLSPVVSLIPFIYGAIRKNKSSFLYIIVIISLISYLYVPLYSDDRTRFIERYNDFYQMGWNDYLSHLLETKRPDFIFESLIYFFAQFKIRIELLFFLITFFSLFNFLKTLSNASNEELRGSYFILLILSISFLSMFSGVRYTFATSLAILGFGYLGNRRVIISIVLFLLSILTHFSMCVFIPVILLRKTNIKIAKFIFCFSLLFLIFPTTYLGDLLQILFPFESFLNKIVSYTEIIDIEYSNYNSFIAQQMRNLWYYVAIIFALREKEKNTWIVLLILSGIIINLLSSFPIVFDRYLISMKLIFCFYLISVRKNFWLFGFLFSIGFLVDINQMRFNLIESVLTMDNISLYGILSQEISFDRIYNLYGGN